MSEDSADSLCICYPAGRALSRSSTRGPRISSDTELTHLSQLEHSCPGSQGGRSRFTLYNKVQHVG